MSDAHWHENGKLHEVGVPLPDLQQNAALTTFSDKAWRGVVDP
jgi:hypothetical protein